MRKIEKAKIERKCSNKVFRENMGKRKTNPKSNIKVLPTTQIASL